MSEQHDRDLKQLVSALGGVVGMGARADGVGNATLTKVGNACRNSASVDRLSARSLSSLLFGFVRAGFLDRGSIRELVVGIMTRRIDDFTPRVRPDVVAKSTGAPDKMLVGMWLSGPRGCRDDIVVSSAHEWI